MLSQMSNGMHSWEDATQPPSQQSPFSTSPAVNATSAHESCAPYKPSNAAIYSNLVRRSRSLTDADMESLDAEVQPSGRRRSFFSPRKPKAATDHPSNSTLDAAAARSFSGLLPNHLGREDSRSLLDSDRDGATSFTRRNSKADDTDISAGKAKSAKWWSWGSTKAPPKPDGKVPNPVRQNSLPPSAIEPVPQGVLAGGRLQTGLYCCPSLCQWQRVAAYVNCHHTCHAHL